MKLWGKTDECVRVRLHSKNLMTHVLALLLWGSSMNQSMQANMQISWGDFWGVWNKIVESVFLRCLLTATMERCHALIRLKMLPAIVVRCDVTILCILRWIRWLWSAI